MTPQIVYKKILSISDTLLAIEPGTSAKFKYSDMAVQSTRGVVSRLNKQGHSFHVSAFSGNDYFTVTRDALTEGRARE